MFKNKILKNKGLAYKQILFILSTTIIIISCVLIYDYYATKKVILDQLKEDAHALTSSINHRLEQIFLSAQKIAITTAVMLEHSDYPPAKLRDFLISNVAKHSGIHGSCIAFAPEAFNKDIDYFAPYAYRNNGKIHLQDLMLSYNYTDWDWYKIPKKLRTPCWTEPYFDTGAGNVMMTTYSVPFYRIIDKKRHFAGVTTVDISLQWLKNYIKSIDETRSGYIFVISKDGKFISYPGEANNAHDPNSIFELANKLNSPELSMIGRKMIEGKTGLTFYESTFADTNGWIIYAPMRFTEWSLAVFFPAEELFANLEHLFQNVLLIVILGLIILTITVIIITRKITKPLRDLTKAAENISDGEFNHKLPLHPCNDEVGKLAKTFDSMRVSIINYMKNLRTEMKAREEVETEVKVGSIVQAHLLSGWIKISDSVAFTSTYMPYSGVSGDLFDFIPLKNDKILVYIGDISGHGVQASLIMAAVQMAIKMDIADHSQNIDIINILNKLNSIYSRQFPEASYMTMLMGLINKKNNTFTYFSAGHPPVITYDIATGKAELNQEKGSVPIGMFTETLYDKSDIDVIDFNKNKAILLYTDGLFECTTKKNVKFDISSLINIISNSKFYSAFSFPDELLENLKEDNFLYDDDVTALLLFNMDENNSTISFIIEPNVKNISTLLIKASEFLLKNQTDEKDIKAIEALLSEHMDNIIIHGYEKEASSMTNNIFISLDIHGKRLTILTLDKGVEWSYDMAIESAYGIECTKGLKVINDIAEKISYKRINNLNHSFFSIKLMENK